MTPNQAIEALRGRRTVPVTRGSIRSVKELHDQCLSREIPAAMRRPCVDGGG
ncbi:MAG: hypothetical protein KDA24_19020 [Deltaproteobacteria bacterium]|nr:hypothetical protein [Deltaproteobacteria bacterium]